MAFILVSSFNSNEKDENGIRHPIPLTDTNSYLTNIKKFVPQYNSVVYVANDPNNFAITEEWANLVFSSFKLTGLKFKNKTILDNRNKKNAKQIIQSADLILLAGGKLACQLKFWAEIGLKDLIANHRGLVVGGSAGAMNLCKTVFDFPESPEDIDNRREADYFLKGLGFHDEIIIPHFNANTKQYECGEEIDTFNGYILPLSHGREFLAFDDASFILLHNGKAQYFGNFYKIKDGKVYYEQK